MFVLMTHAQSYLYLNTAHLSKNFCFSVYPKTVECIEPSVLSRKNKNFVTIVYILEF